MPNTNSPTPRTVIETSMYKRRRAEARFRWFGRMAIGFALCCLLFMLGQIIIDSRHAFVHTHFTIDIKLDAVQLGISDINDKRQIQLANYDAVLLSAMASSLELSDKRQQREAFRLLSPGAIYQLQHELTKFPERLDKSITIGALADDDVDLYVRYYRDRGERGRLTEQKAEWVEALQAQRKIGVKFNPNLFTQGDSREPELAGLASALLGSAYALLVCLLLAFPLGVGSAVYLEHYAPRNRFTEIIEININNLAAVPSIIFGLLGLAVFINTFGMPKAWPVVGGMVLALMTLPTIIIASRAAIRAVPTGIVDGAIALGASPMQVVLHHILPHAMPGILTGTIIGMAQALGETAPLLLIGMVAFIVDLPTSLGDPATALPVQIFLWSDTPERAFVGKTSAAILVLLTFLIIMNLTAILLRRRFEQRLKG